MIFYDINLFMKGLSMKWFYHTFSSESLLLNFMNENKLTPNQCKITMQGKPAKRFFVFYYAENEIKR